MGAFFSIFFPAPKPALIKNPNLFRVIFPIYFFFPRDITPSLLLLLQEPCDHDTLSELRLPMPNLATTRASNKESSSLLPSYRHVSVWTPSDGHIEGIVVIVHGIHEHGYKDTVYCTLHTYPLNLPCLLPIIIHDLPTLQS